jgi:hypothetical protein
VYDPHTGLLKRRTTGKKVGTLTNGYLVVRVADKTYYVHRIAWLWMTGTMPSEWIDHRNGKGTDNRFTNLRLSTRSQNQQNRPKNKNNASGFKGVSYSAAIKQRPWRATISVNGHFIHLGRFKTKAEAFAAYRDAAQELHGEFARPS